MTNFQNFKLQGCLAVITEHNERICTLSNDTVNLPKSIRDNIQKLLIRSHSLLNEIGKLTPDSNITDEYITDFQHRIGKFVCQVAMVEIKVNYYWQVYHNV